MLNIALAHSWLACSMNVMHLHSSLAQAVFPGMRFHTSGGSGYVTDLRQCHSGADPLLAFPSVEKEEVKQVEGGVVGLIKSLEEKNDPRFEMVKRVADKWGKLDVIDSQFRGQSAVAQKTLSSRSCAESSPSMQSSANALSHLVPSFRWSSSCDLLLPPSSPHRQLYRSCPLRNARSRSARKMSS